MPCRCNQKIFTCEINLPSKVTSATQDLTSDVGRLVGTVEEVRLNPFINIRKKSSLDVFDTEKIEDN